MKGFKELVCDESPKNLGKLEKGFEKGDSKQYMTAVMAEAKVPGCIDFEKVGLYITNNYVVSYCDHRGGISRGPITVLPISEITNLYRSNMFFNAKGREYNFDFFALMFELKDGTVRILNKTPRKTNSLNLYVDAIKCIKNKMAVQNGGAVC